MNDDRHEIIAHSVQYLRAVTVHMLQLRGPSSSDGGEEGGHQRFYG